MVNVSTYEQAEREKRELQRLPDEFSDSDIQEWINRLFIEEEDPVSKRRIELLRTDALPFLVKALEDPRIGVVKFAQSNRAFTARSPLERIVLLLSRLRAYDAVPALVRLMEHRDSHFRRFAAKGLGSIGTPGCIAPMLRALSEKEDEVIQGALGGILAGSICGSGTPEFLDSMFPAIIKLLNRQVEFTLPSAAGMLLTIDAESAVPVLLSPKYFSANNPEVHSLIAALNLKDYLVPHHILLPFMDAIRPRAQRYPFNFAYGEALIAYANNPDANARNTIRAALRSRNETIHEFAAEAMELFYGVDYAIGSVVVEYQRTGFDSMTGPQRHYLAVTEYNEVCEDDHHAHYFMGSSGDHWPDALEGFKAMGAINRARILEGATQLFGPTGPSTDQDIRRQQLESFSPRQDEMLMEFDEAYFRNYPLENLSTLMSRYATAFNHHFTPVKH